MRVYILSDESLTGRSVMRGVFASMQSAKRYAKAAYAGWDDDLLEDLEYSFRNHDGTRQVIMSHEVQP